MVKSMIIRSAITLALAVSGTAATADVLSLSGSLNGLGVTAPDATCAPYPFRGTVTGATGASTLGAFTYNHNICLNGAPGTSAGTFSILFGLDSITGTMTGTATPSAVVGVSDTLFNYVVTGGTGIYAGATGAFTGTGTADARQRPALISISLLGTITPVPEPAPWAMMLLGFAGIGMSMRRRAPVLKPA